MESSQRILLTRYDSGAIRCAVCPAVFRRQAIDITLVVVEDDDEVASTLRPLCMSHQGEPRDANEDGDRKCNGNSLHGECRSNGCSRAGRVAEPTRRKATTPWHRDVWD